MNPKQEYRWFWDRLGELAMERPDTDNHQRYCGHGHVVLGVKLPVRRKLVKEWVKNHQDISIAELTPLLDLLAQGESHEEKSLVGILLKYMPKQRHEVDPVKLENWLVEFEGWAEIDSLCQVAFTANDMLDNWDQWKKTLTRYNQHENINCRRASLVLLTKPVRDDEDERLSKLAFVNVDGVKREKDILITKAVSWLLRSLTKNHPTTLRKYLNENDDSLPAIAKRETWRKLETGRK